MGGRDRGIERNRERGRESNRSQEKEREGGGGDFSGHRLGKTGKTVKVHAHAQARGWDAQFTTFGAACKVCTTGNTGRIFSTT